MMTITCLQVLNNVAYKDNHDLVSACFQANAARFAGWLTLAAGGLAILGAGAAIMAASIQVRLQRQQHEARVAAFWWHMKVVLSPVVDAMENAVQTSIRMKGGLPIAPNPIFIPPDMTDENWENHALLGVRSASILAATTDVLRDYNIRIADITIDTMFAESHFGDFILSDNEITPRRETGFELVIRLSDFLKTQLPALSSVMEEDPLSLKRSIIPRFFRSKSVFLTR